MNGDGKDDMVMGEHQSLIVFENKGEDGRISFREMRER